MKFIHLLSLILSLSILWSCGNKFTVSQVRSLELDYNPASELNVGNSFEGHINAILTGGERVEVTTNRKMEFRSEDIRQFGNQFHIVKTPISFNDDLLKYTIVISDKHETFTMKDSIPMNYRGSLSIRLTGVDGSTGSTPKDKGSTWLFRNGKTGEKGENGSNATNGHDLIVHIWSETGMYFIHVEDTTLHQVFRYKTDGTGRLEINVSGGIGGNAGKGGAGGKGKDGEKDDEGKTKRPGDGGVGGDGGNGGDGGAGGSLRVILHPNAADITSRLNLISFGGEGGDGGRGGEGGKPGEPLEGQQAGAYGANGRQGFHGRKGLDGSISSDIQEFDINLFQ